jgi:hypothetical protein
MILSSDRFHSRAANSQVVRRRVAQIDCVGSWPEGDEAGKALPATTDAP